eukprot:12900655-Prorocentrum_lima.AAC.1
MLQRPQPRWFLENQQARGSAGPLRRHWKISPGWGGDASADSCLVGRRTQWGRASCHKIRCSALWPRQQ